MKSVYRMFTDTGDLLYVGCTGQLPKRLDQHRITQPWWDQVALVKVEHYPNLRAARLAELNAIEQEQPTHNISVHPLWAVDADFFE